MQINHGKTLQVQKTKTAVPRTLNRVQCLYGGCRLGSVCLEHCVKRDSEAYMSGLQGRECVDGLISAKGEER